MINNFKLPQDCTLISLDVVNLFGNLGKSTVVEVMNIKWDIIKEHTKINKKLFLEMVQFILENNYFVFQERYYSQTFGCAMGSKLSPILAQYVMDHLVKSCLEKLPFNVPFLKKYVDDIIMSVPNEEAQTTLSCFNSFCESLQFTLEEEDLEQSVPFLDTKVTRHEDTIRLKWYRKKTHSDKMIHYRSNHSINMKVNVIKQMKERVSKICHESYVGEGLRIWRKYSRKMDTQVVC